MNMGYIWPLYKLVALPKQRILMHFMPLNGIHMGRYTSDNFLKLIIKTSLFNKIMGGHSYPASRVFLAAHSFCNDAKSISQPLVRHKQYFETGSSRIYTYTVWLVEILTSDWLRAVQYVPIMHGNIAW